MDSTNTLSYRPYKSKRHSRTVSAEPVFATDDSPPPAPPKPRPVSVSVASTNANILNGHANSAPSTPTTSSSKVKPPTSTFRHVTPAPSPLRPKPSDALTVSPSFARRSSLRRFDAQPRQRTPSPAANTPPPPNGSAHASTSNGGSPLALAVSITPPVAPSPPPSIPHSPSPTPSNSTASTSRRLAAPYRPGFQPKGVYRPLTDQFLAARATVRNRGKVEQRRLERRLEKLIALHFPPESQSTSEKPPASRRVSSIFDIDLSKNPAHLLREVIDARIQPKLDVRAEEQSITPWEDDMSVSQCPLCTASFHPLTTRKHHCRLCGRIVCALPPRPPTRPQTCSLLFVVDQHTRRIDEVGEGVDYGVRKKGQDDRFLRGVRICRNCRVILLRQQYLQDANHVPTYARLYSTLTNLEKEIEEALPHFQELVLSLSTSSSTSEHASISALRTRLLASFAEYDRLAKRIRQLAAPRGGSQDRVQAAILTRATLFLQKNMFPLQSLPKQTQGPVTAPETGKDEALAHALQPLLEQEALLETFVEEAHAQRKFEDARTLKASLSEIRAEIERIALGV